MLFKILKTLIIFVFSFVVHGSNYKQDILVLNKMMNSFFPHTNKSLNFSSKAKDKISFQRDILQYFESITKDKHLDVVTKSYKKTSPESKKYGDIYYLKLKDFQFSIIPNFDDMLRSQKIILDLRGNYGGSYQNVLGLLHALTGLKKKAGEQVFPPFKTPLKNMITRTFSKKSMSNLRYLDLKDCLHFDCRFEIEEKKYINTKKEEVKLSKSVYVLYDRECFSGCEQFLLLSRGMKNIKTFSSSRSRGGAIYGGSIILKLPTSRLMVSIPRVKREYTGIGFNLENGIPPSIYIQKGISIKDFIEKYVRE